MKKRILSLLICPACGGNLDLKGLSEENAEVKDGLLECYCGQWFPIINFIPRILLKEFREDYGEFLEKYGLKHLQETSSFNSHPDSSKVQVQKSFGAKWMSQPSWGVSGETNQFMREWILKKYGWSNLDHFRESLAHKRNILDAGTGLGREVINFCEACKNGEVFGVDLSGAVEGAYINTRQYPNAHIVQADLTRLPFKKGFFDFIFSEGVLHHTPKTKAVFEVLVRFLAPKGEIAIYIYRKKGPIREFCDDYIRQFTTRMSGGECWEFSGKMTRLGKALSDLKIEFELTDDIPELRIKAGRYNLQRFFYYHILKCFWNDRFSFEENNLINFDWYHPVNAHRHTPEEVKSWFQEAGLKPLHFDISESGITVRGLNS